MASITEDIIVSWDIASLQELSVTQINVYNFFTVQKELNRMYEILPE